MSVEDLAREESELSAELARLNRRIEELTQRRDIVRTRHTEVMQKLDLARLQASDSSGGDYSALKVFPWSQELERVRNELFRIPEFRPLQLPAINAFLDGRDVILVMPTGAGKSLVYQLPSFLQTPEHCNKFTLVISPLVSLMTDQAINLRRLGVPEGSVEVLDSSTSPQEQMRILRAIGGDEKSKSSCSSSSSSLRVLYVTPEKLSKSKRLLARLEKAGERLARVAVDEVHCVSAWGHDFRPDYRAIRLLRSPPFVAPGHPSPPPLLGLTATAAPDVVLDILRFLRLDQRRTLVLRAPYNRPNLSYEVKFQTGPMSTSFPVILDLLKKDFAGQSGIIYCLSQKDTETLTAYLKENKVPAAYYHANVDPARRERDHIAWLDGKIRVIVATVAFGMGIDKPDVGFVVHASPSKSLENYYQESGRAGRVGPAAALPPPRGRVLLFWRLADFLQRLAPMVFAEQTGLSKLLHGMCAYAVETRVCRRRLLAEGLGDLHNWRPEDCLQVPCDVCVASGAHETYEMDASPLIERMHAILEENRAKSQRLTGVKLVDLLVRDRGVAGAFDSVLSLRPSRRQLTSLCEFLVAWGLCHEVVALDFHFTPYATIAYLLAGSVGTDEARIRFPRDVLVVGSEPEAPPRKRCAPSPTPELHSE